MPLRPVFGPGAEMAERYELDPHEVANQTRIPSVKALLSAGANRVADFLLPPLCLSCRSPIHAHGALCGACWAQIDFIVEPCCDRLGIPLAFPSDGKIVSAAALADPPVYDRARAVARYDGVMRELIHALKYGDRHEGVSQLGRWLMQSGAELLDDAELIVPVPLARTRLWNRRFNQAALLAKEIGRERNIPDNPLALERIRRTVSQVGLSVEQRKRNVAGAFRVPDEYRPAVAGRNILLVDDVITTGATANACARALKRAGASRVDIVALARVVDPIAPTF